MRKTAIVIKTAPGRRSLLWCLEAVRAHFRDKPHRIYISDEEPVDLWKKSLYKELVTEGHHVEVLPERVGVGRARNHLVTAMQDEAQVLRLDDDFELGGEFSAPALEEVLWSFTALGFVSDLERQIGAGKGVRSGVLRPGGGAFQRTRTTLVKKFHSPFARWQSVNDIRFRFAEFTRNLLLIKREVFDFVRWNEELLFQGEHVDFMLSLRNQGFRGAYTCDSIHMHRDDLAKYRETPGGGHTDPEGRELKAMVLKKSWGVDKERTAYGPGWRFYEGMRRLVCR